MVMPGGLFTNPQLAYKSPQLDYNQQVALPDFCAINN
jgi:hypothetical protein